MIPPAESLLRYETPVLVSRNTEKRSPKVGGEGGGRGPGAEGRRPPPGIDRSAAPQARPLKGTPQLLAPAGPVSPPKGKAPSPSVDPSKQAEEILNAILPPR